MSSKPDTKERRGVLSEVKNFVFTLLVVTVGLAFLVALFNGGITGAEELLGNVVRWLIGIIEGLAESAEKLGGRTQG